MAPTMQTRRAAAMEEQQKLKNALQEIHSLKQLNEQLLREHDDSEVELRVILAKNSQLKAELANLNNAHTLVLEERNKLQEAVGSFDECIQTYEMALSRITMLEDELRQAKHTIEDLQSQLDSHDTRATNNLYDQLLASSSSAPVVTIDLTCDSPCAHNHKISHNSNVVHLNSHKKIKKYLRIEKFIKKTKKLIKTQKASAKNVVLRKERSNLLNKLDSYSSSLQDMRIQYESDVLCLNNEILRLETSLKNISSQYKLSQEQISEHILVADDLLTLSNYNMDRFDSLLNKCQCADKATIAVPVDNKCIDLRKTCGNNIVLQTPQRKTFVVSDGLGKDFGCLLSNKLHQKVFNICHPRAPYEYIIGNIKEDCLDKYSTVVLLIGDSLKITKKSILKSFDYLLSVQKKSGCKFILCAFPYSGLLNDSQNRYVDKLNKLLYTLTCSHKDYFHLFDTNKFINNNNFTLTNDNLYLPIRYKKQIATLVAYNIQDPAIFSLNDNGKSTCCTNNIYVVDSSSDGPGSTCSTTASLN